MSEIPIEGKTMRCEIFDCELDRQLSTLKTIGIGVFALATLFASTASSLDFPSELVVYREDYLGEVAYPLTPEIDEIGAGGLNPFAGFPEPVLTGASAHVSGSVSTSIFGGNGTLPGLSSISFESTGLRGRFVGLDEELSSNGSLGLGSGFDMSPAPNGNVNALVTVERDAAGLTSAAFRIQENDGNFSGIGAQIAMALTAGETAALLGPRKGPFLPGGTLVVRNVLSGGGEKAA